MTGLQGVTVDAGGYDVYARVSVAAGIDAPALVMVHGIGVASSHFVPLAQRLAPHLRVYAPDFPGFGESPAKEDLRLEQLADVLADWMDAIQLERAVILGNSVGCQVVALFAVRHPRRVERLVLVGPTHDPASRQPFRALIRWALNGLHETGPQLPVGLKGFWAAGLRRLVVTFQDSLTDRIEDQLPLIDAQTLVVRGERDALVPQRWAERVVRLLPDAELVIIPHAAHTVTFTDADQVAAAILRFVRDGEPSRAV